VSKNPYIVFNKLILFQVEAYLARAIEDGMTKEDIHMKLISGIRSYMTMGRFSAAEAKLLEELGETPTAKHIKEQQISFVVYAMELIKLWVENVPLQYRKSIYLGVGNKKLRAGRAYFALLMLKQKMADKKKYDELRVIIDSSVVTAKRFYMYFEKELVK